MSRRPAYPLRAVEDLRRRSRDAAREALAERIEATRRAEEAVAQGEATRNAARDKLAAAQRDLYQPPVDLLDEARLESRLQGDAALERRLEDAAVEHRADRPLSVAVIDARRRGIEALKRRLDAAAVELRRLEEAVEIARQNEVSARDELNAAARELEALEKHRARWRAAVELEERRREAGAIDEIVTSAFTRRRAAEGMGGVS